MVAIANSQFDRERGNIRGTNTAACSWLERIWRIPLPSERRHTNGMIDASGV